MNYDQLKRNIGHSVKLMPPECHLNAAGEVEGCPLYKQRKEATLLVLTLRVARVVADVVPSQLGMVGRRFRAGLLMRPGI
jgi:hypothetical protein